MDSGSQIINSTAFVKVEHATISFTQGGASPSCVIVQFSAATFAHDTFIMNVRVLLDDLIIAEPGELTFATNDGANAVVRTSNFFFSQIAPGAHAIQVQLRSIGGDPVVMGRHSTMVQFAP